MALVLGPRKDVPFLCSALQVDVLGFSSPIGLNGGHTIYPGPLWLKTEKTVDLQDPTTKTSSGIRHRVTAPPCCHHPPVTLTGLGVAVTALHRCAGIVFLFSRFIHLYGHHPNNPNKTNTAFILLSFPATMLRGRAGKVPRTRLAIPNRLALPVNPRQYPLHRAPRQITLPSTNNWS